MPLLEDALKEHARYLGWGPVGIAPASAADDFAHLRRWLDQGHAGAMDYMQRHAEARRHPAALLPAVRSVVMLGMNYDPGAPPADDGRLLGRVARYAGGLDYHD